MADVRIPIQTKYDGRGFDQLRKDAERAQRELLKQTRQQIREQKRLGTLSRKLERDLAREAREQERATRKRNQALREGAEAVAIAAGIIGTFAIQSVQAADEAERLERAFFGLSGGSEQAAANLAAMERATRELASEQEQMAIANQLLGMNIVTTSDELEKVVGVSRRLGKTFRGLGAKEAAEEFALMMSNMSIKRLDTFGLSSGRVSDRINELMESGQAANREQAFFMATMEEADKVLARLGDEYETTDDRVEKLGGQWAEFQVEFGKAIKAVGSGSGAFDWLGDVVERMAEGARGLQMMAEYAHIAQRGMEILNEEGKTTLGWMEEIPIIGGVIQGLDFWGSQITRTEELNEAMTQAGQELADQKRAQEEAAQAAADATRAMQAETEAVEESTNALGEQAERLEEVTKIRRDFARDLIDIDERAQEDIADTWDDYFESEADAWESHQDNLAKIKKQAAKEAKRAEQDLAKELKKANEDEKNQIIDLQEKAAQEERHESKRAAVDALADQRLFDFEMRQLAAEGNANAIREAMERREIEQEIAKEKAATEAEIEDEKLADEIERVRASAEERRSQLQQDAAEEKSLREERLQEELTAEEQSYADRLADLREYRDEKLKQIEESKQESIAKLGEELAEAGDLTKEELAALVPVAGELGEKAGRAFSEGLNKGFETLERISEMLGEAAPDTGEPSPSELAETGPQFNFQGGGVVPGPLGAPRRAIVHGGEIITDPRQGGININVGGIGGADLAAILERKVNEGLQEYTDSVLVPILGE